MDRRSWLWRRKSSEKSPGGETESSGSISSHSERFSDDQGLSSRNTQSPEVTSKTLPADEELNESVKTLSEKLSDALLNIRAKEDLVKQHAKVAEEAVSGWEKAETEVLALKKEVEALTHKNLILEERAGHLDGALKECLRQLRLAREEQQQKINDAVAQKNSEWESTKSELENQIVELRSQLQNDKMEAMGSMLNDLRVTLDALEKEKSTLLIELQFKDKELKIRTRERDLSTNAAEAASKQHLDSTKKLAKLEVECLRLKSVARKAAKANDHRSIAASSVYVESLADSQSHYGERLLSIENSSCKTNGLELIDSSVSALVAEVDQFKEEKPLGRNLMVPSVEIDLMDDFLEMERLAAQPMVSGGFHDIEPKRTEQPLRAELDALINRTAELEDRLKKTEEDKVELEAALNECQNLLKSSQGWLGEMELELGELRTQLAIANEAKQAAEVEVEATNIKLKKSTKLLEKAENNLVALQNQLVTVNEAKSKADVELKSIKVKKEEADSCLKVVDLELKTLHSSIGALEEQVQKERVISVEAVAKCQKLEDEISRIKMDSQLQRLSIIEELRINQDKELAVAANQYAECQKTIASLGRQLKSLATLEDFLIDPERPMAIT